VIDDVVVVGGGPAGRALAAACGAQGLRTTLVDPAPARPWRVTYGSWATELPPGLPAGVVAARARGRAVALTARELGREYVEHDVAALRSHLDTAMEAAGVTVRAGRAVAARAGVVALADGTRLPARLVVDAAGHRRPLGPRRGTTRPPAEQTAYGLVVAEAVAAPLVAPGEALFMDWRPDHGEPGWPTFLYAVPVGGNRVLLEETSLARRPGLALPDLRRRLHARLSHHNLRPPADAAVEAVRFPVDLPRHRAPGVLGFGAAAPLVHPATGFSVATALSLAPAVAVAIARALPRSPEAALAAARRAVWPPRARAVHRFRRVGLEALLRMPPDRVAPFFEVFFDLPERHRWSYLSAREDLAGTAATMRALFAAAGWDLRARLVLPALLPPLGSNDGRGGRTGCPGPAGAQRPRHRR
jgi:lycopene beta-cyclase